MSLTEQDRKKRKKFQRKVVCWAGGVISVGVWNVRRYKGDGG